MTTAKIHRQLSSVYGGETLSVQHLQKWVHDFLNGCEEVHDLVQVERLSTARTSDTNTDIRSPLEDDCRYTV